MPDPRTGEKMGISSTFRITAMPAYVVDPEKPVGVTVIAAEERRKGAFNAIRAALIKSTTTKVVQGVPPGTSQGAFPALERNLDGLPSADYFLTTLDRPHYDKDLEAAILKRGRANIFDDPLDAPKPKPEPSAKPAPDKQVKNEAAPTVVADAKR